MNGRFRTFLSVGALLFTMVDGDKTSAVAMEVADRAAANEIMDRSVANECAERLRGQWHDHKAFISPTDIGRLSRFSQLMGANDSIALKLTFMGPRSTYVFARQKLQEHKAHFIQQGLREFKPLQSFWQARDPHGTGRLDIRVTKSEMVELRPFIELADDIEPVDAVGREDTHHILRGAQTFEERIDHQEAKHWQWIAARPEKVIHVQTITSYDRSRFKAIADKIDRDNNGVRVARRYYDSLLSIGYLTLEAKVQDLKSVVESCPEIHLVHVTGV